MDDMESFQGGLVGFCNQKRIQKSPLTVLLISSCHVTFPKGKVVFLNHYLSAATLKLWGCK